MRPRPIYELYYLRTFTLAKQLRSQPRSEESLKMSDIGNPEQEDFEAQVTDSVLADEEEVKPTVQKTADKAIGRSRSRSTSKHKSRSYRSRSRSRSYSRSRRRKHRSRSHGSRHRSSRYREGRSHSRSPMSDRRRHHGDRENPTESSCLGVFGLSLYTTERDLRDVYEHYGTLTNVNVVYDHQTGRSRGFAFVMFANTGDATAARESTNGTEVDGRRIRVDFSITERAHTPTPGVYMGKPTSNKRDFNRGERGYHPRGYHRSPSPHYYRRSPSPYYRRTPSPHYYRRSPSPYYRHHHHSSRRHHYYPREPRERSFSPSRY
ncbi:transformer-2 protein homolog alpha [Strongylocentrotus purpuratus]|uniref:RRM domain-containing protein n=2 Tax=Strongylocentrotus purpuratus TaxID=7668 RepID=A0A7M7P5S7_STRPU|nr:transformer-2 protein homolog alpha [Strongylocentrotus purpuratus]